MQNLIHHIQITINPGIYLKNPESSDLGKRMISEGIHMIASSGFDNFTFRKLGERIGSNESSVYRYFENKHKFLIYLTSWYWGWLEYRLVLETNSITDAREKLDRALTVITQPVETDDAFGHIDEVALNRIMVNEYSKPFLTAEVDEENKAGYFEIYKRLIARVSEMISNVLPDYPYSNSLVSTILEGSLHQYFLAAHFPSLTNCNDPQDLTKFFKQVVFSSLDTYGKEK
ncbi:DNA-binding transcriptional regulator, AcrR family [Robiginitalea myxolifaciens]|uniref:DNA-binding transcriptional regulator, AcrR family n=1 Tax=Robiginitalea myxolifaciens TaxID=400055 RepID=A0A1I6G8G9_9FLAO|nr:TetR/AcrR family transcriptional regulator [Robiginitalea myxolifaciens]SFR38440.1 DNA-binding transcriptional regulator, AcrR family [Robiginitalea myxolifaciens]